MTASGWMERLVSLTALLAGLAAPAAAWAEGEEPAVLDMITVEGQSQAGAPAGPGEGYYAGSSNAATKTGADILETPQAIQVLTRQLMDDQGSRSMTDVLRNAAGVMPGGYYYGWDYFRIRGFDADTAMFVDGLSNSYYVSGSLDPFLFDRIEVVRGPASALYGAGSLGGMVNAVSKRPRPETFAEIEGTYGTQGDWLGTVDAGAVLTADQSLYGRMLLLLNTDDSFIDHVDPSTHVIAAPSLTWQPSASTRFTLLTQYVHDKTEGAPTLPARGTVRPNANGSIPRDRFLGEPDSPEEVDFVTKRIGYEVRHAFNDTIAVRQNARVTWYDQDWHRIIYPWAFPSGDDRTLMRFFYARESEATAVNVDTAGEARFATGALDHVLAFCVDYNRYHEESDASDFTAFDFIDVFDPVYGNAVPPLPLTQHAETTARQLGFYVQDQIRFDRLTLTVGGRYSRASVKDGGQTSTDRKVTPRIGITYEFAPGFAAYANYSESFNPQPGFTTASGSNVEPETGRNYEAGVKADTPDGTLSGTVALFHLTRQNVANADASGRFYKVSGEQRSRGIEADIRWSPVAGLDLLAAYTYTDIEVTKDTDPAQVGDTPRNVPEHMVSSWAHYRLQSGPFAGLGFGAGARHYTKQQGDLPNTFTLPAYTLVDTAVSYEVGPFSARLNVNNLFNEKYYVGSYSDFYVLPGAPTEARFTLGCRF